MSALYEFPDFFEKGEPPCASADPDAFFPEKDQSHMINSAKRVCHSCDYKIECLQWAMDKDEIGIWGGTTAYERRQLKRGKTIRQSKQHYFQ